MTSSVRGLAPHGAVLRADRRVPCSAMAVALAATRAPRVVFHSSSFSRRHRSHLTASIVRAQWNSEVAFGDALIAESGRAGDNLHRLLIDLGPRVSGYSTPGQFIQAKVGDTKPGFFALASPPGGAATVVELLLKPVAGSTAETITSAPEGSVIQVSDVMGKGFPIDRAPASSSPHVFLFATGSGISPIKALIESGALESQAREGVTLYYGVRSPAAMAYADRLSTWENEHGVKVVPVYSEGGQGYVQDVFARTGGIKNLNGEEVAAVLCGQKAMAEAITEILMRAGVAKEKILLNF